MYPIIDDGPRRCVAGALFAFRSRCTSFAVYGYLIPILCASILISASYEAFGQTPLEVQTLRKREIVDVRFEGNTVLSDPQLQNVVLTFSASWFEHAILNWINSGLGSAVQYIDPPTQDGDTLRIQVPAPFRLHWTCDEWHTVEDTSSARTALGIDFVDVPIPAAQRRPIRFTFFWTNDSSWEGRDYVVEIEG